MERYNHHSGITSLSFLRGADCPLLWKGMVRKLTRCGDQDEKKMAWTTLLVL